MNKTQKAKISRAIATGNRAEIVRVMRAAIRAADSRFHKTGKGGAWCHYARRFLSFVQSGKPEFSLFAEKGNKKEPFLSWSELPGADFCPGAGDCLNHCYSFRSWRYPAAFFRQCQNTLLAETETGQKLIRAELFRILNKPKNRDRKTVDFRLFVDGDFKNPAAVSFWFSVLAEFPKLAAYGYSKSFAELLAYAKSGGVFPSNYLLNISSGHNHGAKTVTAVSALPVARGQFVTVNTGEKVTAKMHGQKSHQKKLRAVYGKKAFTCPGTCGACLPDGAHACGADRFRGVDIIIAVH